MIDLDDSTFDDVVSDALDAVPLPLLDLLDNVVFLVEDEPPRGQGELLGMYEGVPLTERYADWGPARLPDRITIFRGPTRRLCTDAAEARREIAITVVHEIAHHFGIAEDRLHELGWG